MRKISELTADDFPGVDSVKFQEWKTVFKNARRNLIIAAYLYCSMFIIH